MVKKKTKKVTKNVSSRVTSKSGTTSKEYLSTTKAVDNFRKGWKLMKDNFIILLGIVVLIVAIEILVSILDRQGAFLEGILPIIIAFFFSAPLNIGANWVALRLIRKEKQDVGNVFDVFKTNYWNAVLASFLTAVFVILGLVLLIIPGIYIAIRLAFVSYLIADKKMEAMDAIRKSWKMTKGYEGTILLMILLGILIILGGLIILGVGAIVSIMWIMSAMAVLYHTVSTKKNKN